MTEISFANDLLLARRQAGVLPTHRLPAVADVDEAYRIQTELAQLVGAPVRGWKVTALGAADQHKFRSQRPVAGFLSANYVYPNDTTLQLDSFIVPVLECEIAFVLNCDLPLRATPYSRDEIVAAISQVVATFEIPDNRVPLEADDLLKLADFMGNGALIVGVPILRPDFLDVTNIDISLSLDGRIIETGSSARILGDPLLAVIGLANAQPLPAGGLRKGQIVTTGTCTTPVKLQRGHYTATFGAFGQLSLIVV